MGQKKFQSENFLDKKNIWVKKIGGKKIFGSKKDRAKIFWVIKIFEIKKCWIQKFFLFKKKQVGLTQGGGYMTPPSPENSRVKIVLDCC